MYNVVSHYLKDPASLACGNLFEPATREILSLTNNLLGENINKGLETGRSSNTICIHEDKLHKRRGQNRSFGRTISQTIEGFINLV